MSPHKRKAAVKAIAEKYKLSERRACRVLLVNRTASRYEPVKRADDDEVSEKIIYLACNFGRVGYRMVTNMLRNDGILINHKRVERIWREEGLKLPKKQTKKRRLWMKDGSCVRLRAEHRNHVWSYDFVEDKTVGGRKLRWLNIIDECTHECLFSQPKKYWKSINNLCDAAKIEFININSKNSFFCSLAEQFKNNNLLINDLVDNIYSHFKKEKYSHIQCDYIKEMVRSWVVRGKKLEKNDFYDLFVLGVISDIEKIPPPFVTSEVLITFDLRIVRFLEKNYKSSYLYINQFLL